MPNNLDYVSFLERIYRRGDCYILGGFGNTLTPAFIDAKCRQYLYNAQNKATLIANMGHIAHDCYGMLKSFLWGNEDGGGRYNAAQDRNETMAINAATEKGDLPTIQKMLGVAVWKTDHVGFVVDCTPADYRNWIVIECYSIPRGILRRTLAEGGWMKWFKDTLLEYKNQPVIQPAQEATNMAYLVFGQKIRYTDRDSLDIHPDPRMDSPVKGTIQPDEICTVDAIVNLANGQTMVHDPRGWYSMGGPDRYWFEPVVGGDTTALEAQIASLGALVDARDARIVLQDGQLVDERNEVARLNGNIDRGMDNLNAAIEELTH